MDRRNSAPWPAEASVPAAWASWRTASLNDKELGNCWLFIMPTRWHAKKKW
jgi:hypothetical protein